MADEFDVPVGGKLTPEQLNRVKGVAAEEENVIGEFRETEDDVVDAVSESKETAERARNYQYPVTGLSDAPARLIFTAHKIDPAFSLDKVVDTPIPNDRKTKVSQNAEEREQAAKIQEAEEAGFLSGVLQNTRNFVNASYENTNANNPQGTVTLPLYKGLQYQDGVTYNVVDLGALGVAQDVGRITDPSGKLGGAAKALAAQAAAKAVGGLASVGTLALASKALGTGAFGGALTGAVVGGNIADQAGAAAKAASRVSMAPNERTLFERVNMRTFAFTFKMIARNEREAAEVKNIVKFFRQEVYPEAIRLTEGGAPFAYEFPNVFTIDIKNKSGYNPGFNIGRCYLESVNTTFNSTATGLYNGEEFVEVDISLNFREITVLDKSKVRDKKF